MKTAKSQTPYIPLLYVVMLVLQSVNGQSWLTGFANDELDMFDPLTGLPFEQTGIGEAGVPDPAKNALPNSDISTGVILNAVTANTDKHKNAISIPDAGDTNKVVPNSDTTGDVKQASRNVVILPNKDKPINLLPVSTKDTTDPNSITGEKKQNNKIGAPLPDQSQDKGPTEPFIFLDPFTGLPVEDTNAALPPIDTLPSVNSGQPTDTSQSFDRFPLDPNTPSVPTHLIDPVPKVVDADTSTDVVDGGFPAETNVKVGDSQSLEGVNTENQKSPESIPDKKFSIWDKLSNFNLAPSNDNFPATSVDVNTPDTSTSPSSIPAKSVDASLPDTGIGGQTDAFRKVQSEIQTDSNSPVDQPLAQPLVPGHVSGEQTGTQPLTDADLQVIANNVLNQYGGGRGFRNAYKALKGKYRRGRGRNSKNKNGRNIRINNRRRGRWNQRLNKYTGGRRRKSGLVKIPGVGLLDIGTVNRGANPRRRPVSRGMTRQQPARSVVSDTSRYI